MLEETILSSPDKVNCSIHEGRVQRKKRHKNEVASPLRDLYDETNSMEEQEYIAAWNQQTGAFGDQLLLTQADRLDHSKAKKCNAREKINLQPTQGFSKCENFLQAMDIRIEEIEKEPEKADAVTKTEKKNGADVEISDSELLYFCEEVEKDIRKPQLDVSIEIENTPPKKETNSIVDSILKDFCSSPSSPDAQMHSPIFRLQNESSRTCNQRSVSMRLNFSVLSSTMADEAAVVPSATLSSEDDNPKFLFNKTPLRTYSRRCIASDRSNFANQCKRIPFDNDCLSDSSSVLSVQEDQTHELNALEINRVHHSQQVCENIQNLSAFFTQNFQNSEEHIEKATISARKENASFNSFNESTISSRMEQTLIAVNNVYQCSSHDVNASSTKTDGGINRIPPVVPNSFDIIKNELKDDIFDESDNEWNDDFFKNFKSEEAFVPKKQNEMLTETNLRTAKQAELFEMHQNYEYVCLGLHSDETPTCLGFQTASRKTISVSKNAEERAATILKNFPELLGLPKDENEITKVDEEKVSNLLRKDFANEQYSASSSNTKLKLAAEIQNQESEILEIEKKTKRFVIKEEMIENGEFVGFLTPSKKSINISEAAKRRAVDILTDLPEIPQKRGKYQMAHEKSKDKDTYKLSNSLSVEPKLNGNNTNLIHTNVQLIPEYITNREFVGFFTASNKSIRISEAAKKRAASILSDLPEIPQKREKYRLPRLVSQENNSNNTQEMDAYRLSTELPVVNKLNVIHTNVEIIPDNIVLSEWPFEENSNMLEPEIKLESLHHEANENKITDTYSKKISKSYTENNLLQNCSFNRTVDDALKLTESNMSPLSSRTTKNGVSRKNLLSLSRSKKIKTENVSALDSARTSDPVGIPIKNNSSLEGKEVSDPSDPHQVPGTPNLKEFFRMATNTSTPARLNAMNKSETVKESNTEFEFIATSKTLSTSKISDISCENITWKQLSMSDKSSIGKPSSNTINNCRVSGLRRRSCRNMKKQ